MDSETFVRELQRSAPTPEDYRKYKVSEQYIERALQRYRCLPKHQKERKVITSDTILNLLQDYDCSKVEIGIITFARDIMEAADYYKIGNAEVDLLVISKITMQVEVRDYDSPDHVMWPCASNSDNFLEALLLCAEFSALKIKDKDASLDDNDKYALEKVERCTEKAGGKKYINFYKMLLAYFD